jgi:hypothetical protein
MTAEHPAFRALPGTPERAGREMITGQGLVNVDGQVKAGRAAADQTATNSQSGTLAEA